MPKEQSLPHESSSSEEHTITPLNGNQSGGTDDSPDPLDEVLEGAPASVKRNVRGFFAMRSTAISSRLSNPLLEKIDETHLHKILDYGEAESQREAQQTYSGRKFAFAFFFVALVAVVGVLLFLVSQGERDLAAQILGGLALFGAGFVGGLGVGGRRR